MPAPLHFRPVMGAGFFASFEGWPAWVRALRHKCGVYVIRQRFSKQVLYIGESHTGSLYKTLTRHFQAWGGQTAGPTYSVREVVIAVRVTPAPAAVAAQDRLILRLHPSDNTQGTRPPSEDPF